MLPHVSLCIQATNYILLYTFEKVNTFFQFFKNFFSCGYLIFSVYFNICNIFDYMRDYGKEKIERKGEYGL